ncbi:polysaccharide biosynthesis domain containing protein 1 [Terramyces sp. JEL0728]|nr:polysaccharide biosynthesis domain containing protein 1 [Terramyces sp. JEL0728]
MSAFGITAETAQNNEDIEKHWAIKAFQHAEVYFNLLSSVPAPKIKLTKNDDELYAAFRAEFKDLDIKSIDEMKDFKTEEKKKQWRTLIEKYEHLVEDFNFGTLLRNRAGEDYGPDNSFFG